MNLSSESSEMDIDEEDFMLQNLNLHSFVTSSIHRDYIDSYIQGKQQVNAYP